MTPVLTKIRQKVEPVVHSLGLELWGVEYSPRRHAPLLRVVIDAEGGVNIDDCEQVSRQLSGMLEVEDMLPGNCQLEVSSPGIARVLYTPEQYRRFVGAKLQLRLTAPLAGRRNFTGRLLTLENGTATLDLDGQECSIPLQQVERANIVSEVDRTSQQQHR